MVWVSFLFQREHNLFFVSEVYFFFHTLPLASNTVFVLRWFKFTLKPPYTIASGNLLSAIWDTSHWTSFVKFGLKTA